MITAKGAYQVFKERDDCPPIYRIAENEEFYISDVSDQDGYITIDRNSGEIGHVRNWYFTDRLKGIHGEREIYLENIFEDFLDYYENNKDESVLARLYAGAYNSSYYMKNSYAEGDTTYKNKMHYDQIKANWINIEQYLYEEIRNIIDKEEIAYPPCVLENFSDPYYRIKPFMLRNGYTTAKSDKTWVIKRNQSNESDTQECTDEQKAWIKRMKQHFDDLLM